MILKTFNCETGHHEEQEITDPPIPQLPLSDRFRSLWDELPVEMRAALRPLKSILLDALGDNAIDEAVLLLQQQSLLPEFEIKRRNLVFLLQKG